MCFAFCSKVRLVLSGAIQLWKVWSHKTTARCSSLAYFSLHLYSYSPHAGSVHMKNLTPCTWNCHCFDSMKKVFSWLKHLSWYCIIMTCESHHNKILNKTRLHQIKLVIVPYFSWAIINRGEKRNVPCGWYIISYVTLLDNSTLYQVDSLINGSQSKWDGSWVKKKNLCRGYKFNM